MSRVSMCVLIGFSLNALTASGAPIEAGAGRVVLDPGSPLDEQREINALVIEAGGVHVAFCAVDTGALDEALVQAVAQRLQTAGSSISADNLMLAATHTHTGMYGGLMPGAIQEMAYGSFSQANVDACADNCVLAIQSAEGSLQPAQIRLAHTDLPDYARNRSYPENPIDTVLSVMAVETVGGTPIAYLVNYAAHPTILSHGPGTAPGGPGRDFPGGIAWELRDDAGSDIPVVFINGALGNVGPNPPAGYTTRRENAEFMGRAIGQAVLAELSGAAAVDDAACSFDTRNVPLPANLLESVGPMEAVLQEFWINGAVFLSCPGEACGQLGIALRAKAHEQGAEHAFLCGLTSDYVGYNTNVPEFFGGKYESEMNFYGPLMIKWYLESHLVTAPRPTWQYSPLLEANRRAFIAAAAEGAARAGELTTAWAGLSAALDAVAAQLPMLVDLPPDIEALIASLAPEDAARLGKQYASFYARQMYASALSDAQRTRLIGLAEGCGLPFDAVMLLQFAANPIGVPPEYAVLFPLFGLSGIDFAEEPLNLCPDPAFEADTTEPTGVASVQFTDLSDPGTGMITSWEWDFGDGSTSTEQHPRHQYARAGTYSVTLTAASEYGALSYTREDYIEVEGSLPVTGALSLAVLVPALCAAGVRGLRRRR